MKRIISSCLILVSCLFLSCDKSSKCIATNNSDCICTKDYVPVCGCDDITYSNQCHANCVNIEVVSQGECPD